VTQSEGVQGRQCQCPIDEEASGCADLDTLAITRDPLLPLRPTGRDKAPQPARALGSTITAPTPATDFDRASMELPTSLLSAPE
jgi:hypothetical protein